MTDNRERLIAIIEQKNFGDQHMYIPNKVSKQIANAILAEFPQIEHPPTLWPQPRQASRVDPMCRKCGGTGKIQEPCPDGIPVCAVFHTRYCECTQPNIDQKPTPMSPALRERLIQAIRWVRSAERNLGKAMNESAGLRALCIEHLAKAVNDLDAVMDLIDSIAAPVAPVGLPTRSDLRRTITWGGAKFVYDSLPEIINDLIAAGLATEDPEPVSVEPSVVNTQYLELVAEIESALFKNEHAHTAACQIANLITAQWILTSKSGEGAG